MAQAKLTDDHRMFIVCALARFDTPQQIVEMVRESFGISITRQTVQGYDPTKKQANALRKWKPIFEVERKKFIDDTSDIGIAHRSVRLRALERLIEKVEKSGNAALARELIETAAKEVGDYYTNKRHLEHDVPKGSPLSVLLTQLKGSTLPVAKTPAKDADG